MNLAGRSIRSTAWQIAAGSISLALLLVRSLVLARLLPVDTFGVYVVAASCIALSAVFATFGFGAALVYRAPETLDEGRAAATHFTLTSVSCLAWLLIVVAATSMLANGSLRIALIVLALSQACQRFALTPQAIFARRVDHRRLAAMKVGSAACTSAVSILLALHGFELGALLAVDVTAAIVTLLLVYAWRPVWRPRFSWDPEAARYFMRFGASVLLGHLLNEALQRLDRLWVGAVLGDHVLGLYARAYGYSRGVCVLISRPVSTVATGTFAAIAGERRALSKAAHRVAYGLFRISCLAAGVAGSAGEEIIGLLIGEKWLPMVPAFNVLLIAFVLNPVATTFLQLLAMTGHPTAVVCIRAWQLGMLTAGVITVGSALGLLGVAASVLATSVLGLILALRSARGLLDINARSVLLPSALCAVAALACAELTAWFLPDAAGAALAGAAKAGTYCAVFVTLLWRLERGPLTESFEAIATHLHRS